MKCIIQFGVDVETLLLNLQLNISSLSDNRILTRKIKFFMPL